MIVMADVYAYFRAVYEVGVVFYYSSPRHDKNLQRIIDDLPRIIRLDFCTPSVIIFSRR